MSLNHCKLFLPSAIGCLLHGWIQEISHPAQNRSGRLELIRPVAQQVRVVIAAAEVDDGATFDVTGDLGQQGRDETRIPILLLGQLARWVAHLVVYCSVSGVASSPWVGQSRSGPA